jgi:hypothetical protein
MSAAERLRKALKALDDERFYNGHIPSYVNELASAASELMYEQDVKIAMKPTLRDVFPDADEWEIEEEFEGGQPNGIGEIESNDSREWFFPENETHHRLVYHIRGAWQEGPTYQEAQRRLKEAAHKAKLAEEAAARKEAARPSEEEEILRKAQEILDRRKANEPLPLDDKPWIHVRFNGFTRYSFSNPHPRGSQWEPREGYEQDPAVYVKRLGSAGREGVS